MCFHIGPANAKHQYEASMETSRGGGSYHTASHVEVQQLLRAPIHPFLAAENPVRSSKRILNQEIVALWALGSLRRGLAIFGRLESPS